MLYFTALLFLITTYSFQTSASEFPEINYIKEVADYIDPSKKTFVLFDIDNTLLCPTTDLGSEHWYDYTIQQKMATGLDKETAHKQTLPLALHLHFHLDFMPIEPSATADIATIQVLCDRAVCLTSRSPVLIDITLKHFDKHLFYFHMPELDQHIFDFEKPSIYKRGIIACGWNNKGTVLLNFLKVADYMPEVIIFVDNKSQNLENVKKYLKGYPIHFIGIRYAGCDHKVHGMNHQALEAELKNVLAARPYTDEQYAAYF